MMGLKVRQRLDNVMGKAKGQGEGATLASSWSHIAQLCALRFAA
jgi:hypothetical protein